MYQWFRSRRACLRSTISLRSHYAALVRLCQPTIVPSSFPGVALKHACSGQASLNRWIKCMPA
eukprot:1444320-Amphidinium_carterae.1